MAIGKIRKSRGNPGKWQKSVAQYMEEQGKKYIKNEDLSPKHDKIKNPNKYKK